VFDFFSLWSLCLVIIRVRYLLQFSKKIYHKKHGKTRKMFLIFYHFVAFVAFVVFVFSDHLGALSLQFSKKIYHEKHGKTRKVLLIFFLCGLMLL
ncbi:MAG: hypothetical protein U9P79_07000, partial [Candidatus Cloacimonadota bacterium]|nr:hypothetical protein [Candidatus Cloacimonadota bacterium]